MQSIYSRILVVDDSATTRKIVCKMLKEAGFSTVDQAHDGVSALALLKIRRYRLVISDWNMKPMNGLDLLKAIRQSYATDIDFIMMTAHALKFAEVARDGEVFRHLVKPFTSIQLIDRIRAGLSANLMQI